jgi:AdoMet-dependent rRNA methyltransferase SPB1
VEQDKGETEIVPQKKLEDYDIEDLATNLALAKKMMRKKTREQIIDNSFNRMNIPDEDEDLPKWFADDEKKHNFKIPPITKEEYQ